MVLLRGLCRSQYHWHDFPDKLKIAFPTCDIRYLDLAGNGSRYNETSPDSVTKMVEDLRGQLGQVDQPIYLVALSLGGMIGLKWLDLHPEDLKKVWIINTSVSGTLPVYKRIRIGKLIKILVSGIKGLSNRETQILKATSQRGQFENKDTKDIVNDWVEIQRNYPVSYGNFFRQLKAAIKFKLNQLNLNVKQREKLIFVNGEKDNLVSPLCTATLADMYNCPLLTHSQSGHDLTLDEGDWLIQNLRSDLSPGT